MKPDSHLVTYPFGNSYTQVDYILTRRRDPKKQVQNVKVNGNEEFVTQHKLFVYEIILRTQIRKQHKPPPKWRIWKLQKTRGSREIQKKLTKSCSTLPSDPDSEADVESIWTEIKSCLINACDSVYGWTKGNCKQERETWWWDETVEIFVKQKRKL